MPSIVPHVINSDTEWRGVHLLRWRQDHNILAIDGADPRAGQNKGQKGWAIADIITFTDISWFGGDHTIKLGVKYKDVDLTAAGLGTGTSRLLLRRDPGRRGHRSRGSPSSRCRWRVSIPA